MTRVHRADLGKSASLISRDEIAEQQAQVMSDLKRFCTGFLTAAVPNVRS